MAGTGQDSTGEDSATTDEETANMAELLEQLLRLVGASPSHALLVYFDNCSSNPSQNILQGLDDRQELIRQGFQHKVNPSLSFLQKLFQSVHSLYFHMMESILRLEQERLSVQDFSKLLHLPVFHSSLHACALEVVFYVHRRSSNYSLESILFPWVLEVLKLTPYDFYKVLESFVRAEPALPGAVVQHLQRCEHSILDCLAWSTGSPIFDALQCCCDGERQSTEASPWEVPIGAGPRQTAASMYLSPQKLQPEGIARSNVLVESPPTGKTSPQKPPRYSSVLLFQRKVGRLAYVRLKQLCCEVRLHTHHPKLERTIWTLLEHTILKEFTLLKDRHLDQVILCSMYGVCKVHNVDLRFKTIVTSYKTLPHANPKTFRQVLIRDGKFDTIIVFYNLVFMQRLKNNILSLASTQSPNLSPIPPIPMSPSNAARSPICVPGHPNITVNSLNQSGYPGSMTPRSRVLTCIGEFLGSPGRQTINLTVEPGCIPRSAKRLPFEREGTRNKALPLTKKRKLHFEQEDEADEEKEAGTDGEIFGGIGPLQNPKEESSSEEESVVHRKLASLVEERPPTKDNQSGNTPRLCHQ